MNIFATSECPVESAKNLDDKRLVKMVLETAQLLCTALNSRGYDTPYKSTHPNHPCSVWARESSANMDWLLRHGSALSEEYTHRFNRIHKCTDVLKLLSRQIKQLPTEELTPLPNCARNKSLGIDYTDVEDTHMAYQLYLSDRWEMDKKPPRWNGVGR